MLYIETPTPEKREKGRGCEASKEVVSGTVLAAQLGEALCEHGECRSVNDYNQMRMCRIEITVYNLKHVCNC